MTDFRDILYFYPEKKKEQFARNLLFNQGVSFLSAHENDIFRFFFSLFFFYILVTVKFEILRF